MLNVDKLLKKHGWTGRELGRLEVVNMLDMFGQSLKGVYEPKPIITGAELSKMVRTIKDPTEGRIYNGYLSIHEWFSKAQPMALANYQQALLNYNELFQTLSLAIVAEDVYKYVEKLPAIFTEKQYKDIVATRKEEILHPDGEDIGFNVFNLLELALQYYMGLLQKEPRRKNPLKPLKKKLEAELVTDPRILTKYNEVMGWGYYTYHGVRSDKVSSEEWRELNKDIALRIQEDESLSSIEKEASIQALIEGRLMANVDAIYNGATEEEAEKAQSDRVQADNNRTDRPEWHYYEEAPEDLNKWEILETGELYEYYPTLGGSFDTEEDALEDIEAFKKEFPEVVAVLLKDMERYFKGISSLPTKDWATTEYAWEDLYKSDFYGFRSSFVDLDTSIFDGNQRAIYNGVAILRPSDLLNRSPLIDEETGYYKAPDIRHTLASFELDSFFTDSEDYAEKVDKMDTARHMLLSSYYYLLGYNTALSLTATYYDLEEMVTIANYDTQVKLIEQKIKSYNSLLKILYNEIKHTDYEDKAYKEKKLEVLKDVITPISLEGWDKIPEDVLEKVKSTITDFKPYKGEAEDLLLALCYRYTTNEEGEITW